MARQFRTGLIIEGDASGGIRAIRATDDQLKQLNSGFQKGGRQAQRYGRQVSQTDRTLAAIRRTALTAATALASVFAVRSLQGQIDFADQIHKTRDRIGASTEALSQYNYVAQMSGVQLNTLTTAWQRQTRRINEAARGTGVASEALQRLGLDAQALASMRPEDQFEAIAEAMEGIADDGARVALAQKIWDSGGVQLLQMTNQGAAAMREMRQEADRLGLTITNETADNMAAFNDEISRVKFALQGLTATMLAEVVPSLTDGITQVNGWVESLGGAEEVLGHVRIGVSVLASLMAGRAAQSLATYVAGKYAAVAASVALNGSLVTLRTTLLTLMGPVGLIVAGVGLLYTFREELGLVGGEADQTRIDVEGLAGAFRDLTAAQQENKRASLLNELIEMRLEAGRLGTELAEVSQKVRQSGQLTPQGGALPVATPEDIARGRELRAELAGLMTNIDDGTQLLDEYDQVMADLGQTTLATTTNTRTLADSQRESQRAADEQDQAMQRLESAYESLLDRLYPIEASQRRFREEMELLASADAAGAVDDLADAQRRLREANAEQMMGGMADAPEYGGLSGSVGGPLGEMGKIAEAREALQEWYGTQLGMLAEFREQRAELNQQWDEREREIHEQHQARVLELERARGVAQLQAAQSIFGDLTDVTRTFAGEQSDIYQVMFAIQKAAAIAQSIVAIQQGIAMAAANPWPVNLAAMASVAAATAGLVSNIASVAAPQGMAHDGIDSIPREGTWLLDRGERVLNAPQASKLDRFLDQQQAQDRRRDGGVTVNIIENPERAGEVERETRENGDIELNAFVADIGSGGKRSRVLEQTYGLRRQGR